MTNNNHGKSVAIGVLEDEMLLASKSSKMLPRRCTEKVVLQGSHNKDITNEGINFAAILSWSGQGQISKAIYK